MKVDEQLEMIVDKINNHLGEQIDFIVLFGSLSTGYFNPLSDIDIGVSVSNPRKELPEIFGELLSLFDFVDKTSSQRIDITLLNLASLSLRFRVVQGGQILYAKDEEVWPCFVEYVLSRYPDWHYYMENYLKQSLGT
ncbi:MAG: type VII toxin-antitoxin system MntA family adenylyltransferase antitoxin [Candidatus Thorarchaeota archaeon]